jgi:hypothetical protein
LHTESENTGKSVTRCLGGCAKITAFAQEYFQKKHRYSAPRQRFLYNMALLLNPNENHPPSNPGALKKFKSRRIRLKMVPPQ